MSIVNMNVTRAFAEDFRECVANHRESWERESPIDIVVTLEGTEYPLCTAHARQLREMLDEELARFDVRS